MRANQFVTGYISQSVKVESKFTDYELAVMEGGLSLEKSQRGPALREAVDELNNTPGIKISTGNAGTKAWIEKVYAKYPQTFQNNHVMPLGGGGDDQQFAMFELTPSFSKKDAVEVKWFQSYPLRQGVGSRAMQELQALAKEDGISLTLFPWDKGQVSQSKLMKFYKSHGFAPITKGSKSLAWSPVAENFADGRVKGKSSPGRVKRSGASCDGSVSDLRSKAKNASGERAKMYHWCANMKNGRAKNESEMLEDLNVIWKDVLEAGIFRGYPCTKDCSGHAAGYKWSDDRDITDPNQCPYSNNSFWEGCLAHTDEQE